MKLLGQTLLNPLIAILLMVAMTSVYAQTDTDGDGIPDSADMDIDNDGFINFIDLFPSDPTEHADLDGDGVGDNSDPDRDGDSHSNTAEEAAGSDPNDPASVPPPADFDGDGIPDSADMDIDNDGVINFIDLFPYDPTEHADLDGDGIGDNSDPDRDGDGHSNTAEEAAGSNPNNPASVPPPADFDGDGIPDSADMDIDNDGFINPIDLFPYDPTEHADMDGDGVGDNGDPDRDGDGHSNTAEEAAGSDPSNPDSVPPPADFDGDGIPDSADMDIDNDGVINFIDLFPYDPTEHADMDGDGVGDNGDPDRDGDGHSNTAEEAAGSDPNNPASVPPPADFDGDGIPDSADIDIDNDGFVNPIDLFPYDPTEHADLDGDGVGDNADTDRDGDGFDNSLEEQSGSDPGDANSTPTDSDGDGIPDVLDDDRDGDGYNNDVDAFPDNASEWSDIDGDNIGDNADPDRDGDGFDNTVEDTVGTDPNDPNSVPTDTDQDGTPDQLDDDRDGDDYENDVDAFPDDPSEWSDLDGDNIGDNADPDRDGDGFDNTVEDTVGTDPDDPNSVPTDTDQDGTPDELDDDRDGDGYNNDADAFPDDPSEWSDLDGDNIGDNADPDRDGDGFDNDQEVASGSDPDDPNSTPEGSGPQVTANNDGQVVQQDTITITGQVSDNMAVSKVEVINESLGQVTFGAQLAFTQPPTQANYSAVIPLVEGSNTLRIIAFDDTNNQTAITITVIYQPPQTSLNIDTPLDEAVVATDRVAVAGLVTSSLAIEALNLTIAGSPVPLSADGPNRYSFTVVDIPLTAGLNEITAVLAFSQNGTTVTLSDSVKVIYNGGDNSEIAAPVIELLAPLAGNYLNEKQFIVAGNVTSQAGLVKLFVNDRSVGFSSADGGSLPVNASFQTLLELAFSDGSESVEIRALDSVGQSTTETFDFYFDSTGPEIVLDNSLNDYPGVTTVYQQPYPLTGTITDAQLASFTINGQNVPLLPLSDDSYSFAVNVDLPVGEDAPISLAARDAGGNITRLNYIVNLDNTLNLEILTPRSGDEFVVEDEPIVLTVTVRLEGIREGNFAYAKLKGPDGYESAAVPLNMSAEISTALLSVPSVSGDYEIVVEAQDLLGELLSSTTTSISVTALSDIPVEVIRTTPERESRDAAIDAPIHIYFNKPIDPGLATISVKETFNGKSYVKQDDRGVDSIFAKGFQLQSVNRNNEPVAGGASYLEDGSVLIFYPSRDYAYGADIRFSVAYQGNTVAEGAYRVEESPTFIKGIVTDILGEQLENIEVEIEELGWTLSTNDIGGFNFGYKTEHRGNINPGLYTLWVNKNRKNGGYGEYKQIFTIQPGRVNSLNISKLPLLQRAQIHSVSAASDELQLGGGDITIDLSSANLLFRNGASSGNLYLTFTTGTEFGKPVREGVRPQWSYSIQPLGVKLTGNPSLTIQLPKFQGGHGYLSDFGKYALILGMDSSINTLVPIGYGEVIGTQVHSLKFEGLDVLDEISVMLLPEAFQGAIEQSLGEME